MRGKVLGAIDDAAQVREQIVTTDTTFALLKSLKRVAHKIGLRPA